MDHEHVTRVRSPSWKLEACGISGGISSTSELDQSNTSRYDSSCAQNGSLDPRLAVVVNAWSTLSEPVKAAVMALVKADTADD